jgi:hypothetical protein
LQAVYPNYVPEKYVYWKDEQNQKAFFDQLAIRLNIKKPEDWSKVTCRMVLKEGGSFITNYYNSSVQQGNNTPYQN